MLMALHYLLIYFLTLVVVLQGISTLSGPQRFSEFLIQNVPVVNKLSWSCQTPSSLRILTMTPNIYIEVSPRLNMDEISISILHYSNENGRIRDKLTWEPLALGASVCPTDECFLFFTDLRLKQQDWLSLGEHWFRVNSINTIDDPFCIEFKLYIDPFFVFNFNHKSPFANLYNHWHDIFQKLSLNGQEIRLKDLTSDQIELINIQIGKEGYLVLVIETYHDYMKNLSCEGVLVDTHTSTEKKNLKYFLFNKPILSNLPFSKIKSFTIKSLLPTLNERMLQPQINLKCATLDKIFKLAIRFDNEEDWTWPLRTSLENSLDDTDQYEGNTRSENQDETFEVTYTTDFKTISNRMLPRFAVNYVINGNSPEAVFGILMYEEHISIKGQQLRIDATNSNSFSYKLDADENEGQEIEKSMFLRKVVSSEDLDSFEVNNKKISFDDFANEKVEIDWVVENDGFRLKISTSPRKGFGLYSMNTKIFILPNVKQDTLDPIEVKDIPVCTQISCLTFTLNKRSFNSIRHFHDLYFVDIELHFNFVLNWNFFNWTVLVRPKISEDLITRLHTAVSSFDDLFSTIRLMGATLHPPFISDTCETAKSFVLTLKEPVLEFELVPKRDETYTLFGFGSASDLTDKVNSGTNEVLPLFFKVSKKHGKIFVHLTDSLVTPNSHCSVLQNKILNIYLTHVSSNNIKTENCIRVKFNIPFYVKKCRLPSVENVLKTLDGPDHGPVVQALVEILRELMDAGTMLPHDVISNWDLGMNSLNMLKGNIIQNMEKLHMNAKELIREEKLNSIAACLLSKKSSGNLCAITDPLEPIIRDTCRLINHQTKFMQLFAHTMKLSRFKEFYPSKAFTQQEMAFETFVLLAFQICDHMDRFDRVASLLLETHFIMRPINSKKLKVSNILGASFDRTAEPTLKTWIISQKEISKNSTDVL